ncbi:MAG: primosomal protein N' [Alphaproteobacteria bacterium]|nr:primosomal protein N' [Alphaproteobacteria bacterium]
MPRVNVLLATSLDKSLDYRADSGIHLGSIVEVPLAGRKVMGVVLGAGSDDVPEAKMKSVLQSPDVPALGAAFLKFIDWVAEYTLAPRGAVLALSGLAHATKLPRKTYVPPTYHSNLPTLSIEQQNAYEAIKVNGSIPTVLDGVTGSGKTEVYFHIIDDAIKAGKQILILVPEISLTHQWMQRFEKTFGAPPVVWHSSQSPADRKRAWHAVAAGEAKVIVGARSALFLPFKDLAHIIVDEEHDLSYKQEDGVLYHARDMAVVRAKFEDIPVTLVSATPSLETVQNIKAGRYKAVQLIERHGAAGLPSIHLLDMTKHPPERGNFLSPVFIQEMKSTLARGEQVLLFLNRRGYAPLMLCRACGYRFECSDCSSWLVLHQSKHQLHCHHCGHKEKEPTECPSCKVEGKLAACGPGVERIAQEVAALFPEITPLTLSSDEVVDAGVIDKVISGEANIIIGTQMVAKGHHFPNLTLVGVVDADLGLNGGDLRASERTYQLLHQLSGRAGRGDTAGHVYLQTYESKHPVMKALAAGDRDGFMRAEMEIRERGHWPPYGQLAAILLDGTVEAEVQRAGIQLARTAPADVRIKVLGPAPAPLSRLKGQYRYRLLVKADKPVNLQKTLQLWLDSVVFKRVRLKVDVNPYYFM